MKRLIVHLRKGKHTACGLRAGGATLILCTVTCRQCLKSFDTTRRWLDTIYMWNLTAL